jgi:competence protein ComEC
MKFFNFRFRVILILALLGLAVFLFSLDRNYSGRGLTFAMLDIGQGDALFIESPAGTRVLLDAGPPGRILGQMARVMPPFDRKLDAIIISHPDADHISGFKDILADYQVGEIFDPGIADDTALYQSIVKEAKDKNVPTILARRGMRLDLGGGAVIDILFPDRDVRDWETNAGCIVARLAYGGTSVMLTGDSPIDSEKIIMAETPPELLKSTVLKVGHHGSANSSSPEFVSAVSPQYALISVGKNNKYGHPTSKVLDILAAEGAEIYRTDLLGTVIMQSDGKVLKWSYER